MILRSKPAAVAIAACLVFGDAFVLNQGVISGLVAAWIILCRLPRIMLSDKYRDTRKPLLHLQAIYLAGAFTVLAANTLNNIIAQRRGEALVAALNEYHAQNHRYPQSLQELVPAQIKEVPRAKFCTGFNTFWYAPGETDPMFFYVVMPPFGRRGYSFKKKEWFFFD